MGYRSTFVTDDNSLPLPRWFVEKWQDSVYINEQRTLPIASKQEMKAYGHWADLPRDLQRVMLEHTRPGWSTHLVFLHEDGATTQYVITTTEIEMVLNTSSQL